MVALCAPHDKLLLVYQNFWIFKVSPQAIVSACHKDLNRPMHFNFNRLKDPTMNFTICVFSVVDYPEVATLQNWRPVSTTWNTTSRLPTNKGKYVFTSRPPQPLHPQSFSRGGKQQPRRASIEENGGQMMSVITTPHMHFATMPRRPMQKVIKVTFFLPKPLNVRKVCPFFFKRFPEMRNGCNFLFIRIYIVGNNLPSMFCLLLTYLLQ